MRCFCLLTFQLQVPSVDVGIVVEACPLLQKLVLTLEPTKTVTLSHDKDQSILTHLEELQVCFLSYHIIDFTQGETNLENSCVTFQLECQISLDAAALLLTRATRLRVVKLVRVKKLTDQVLASWLRINPFEYLETVSSPLVFRNKILRNISISSFILSYAMSNFTLLFFSGFWATLN